MSYVPRNTGWSNEAAAHAAMADTCTITTIIIIILIIIIIITVSYTHLTLPTSDLV